MYHMKRESHLQIRKTVDFIEKNEIKLITQDDSLYPKALFSLKDPPPLLYVQGTLPKTTPLAITIVGTRAATHYGKDVSYTIAKELAAFHIPIVSGLARGIDTAAHEGALEGGETIALIGSGHGCLYPKENLLLAEKIYKKGAIISEYPPYMHPTRYSFIQRNRLLAALGMGSILIESPLKGGSMVTMEIARTLHRPLFALPASVDCSSFKGNFHLIKKNIAQLIEGADDVMRYFYPSSSSLKVLKTEKTILTDDEKRIYDILSGHEKHLDELVLLTQLPVMKLNILLTSLIIKGAIKEFAGKIYKKNYR